LPVVERKIRDAREHRTVYEHEFRVVWPDRSVHWIIGRGRFLYDGAGDAARMTGVVIDVTPRREAEEASRGLQTQVAHLLRLNLLSQIASGLAHEINQPLTAISNFVGAAVRLHEDGKLSTDRGADILREIASQAHRAGEIVRRLRNFIRGKPAELAPTDLNVMVSDALGLLSHELSASRVKARLEPGARIPKLRVDAVQIQQVLVNLIQNAIDAMREVPPDRRRLTIATIASIGQVIVRVTDSGPGIAPANLEHVFESFFSTKDHGLGMGLNISRSIVESHGGSLTAANAAEGTGAVFEFVLPIGDPPLVDPAAPP
ncbi:MAG TPA: ATP-binding protein, partial [Tepidisphaeraceae bacterium]|nr:ATP-binding protein [Tepidisphaeraceae bacterium]